MKTITRVYGLTLLLLASCGPSSDSSKSTSNKDSVSATDTISHTQTRVAPVSNSSVKGIDVSHFQNDVNWDEVKKAGIQYAYAKATQGEEDVDIKYKRNREGARGAGLYHGAYHFYMAGFDPGKQADIFINTVRTMDEFSMPPVLDLEQGGVNGKTDIKTYQQDVLTWLKKVEAALGIRPVIYTNHPFGNQYLNHPDFSGYDLWIAEYGVAEPKIPEAWKNKGWVMWQRAERGAIEGAIGNVDHDLLKEGLKPGVIR